jgi:hypothetical protein
MVSTLHVGPFRAREVVLICKKCGCTYRSEELCSLVPPGANFGYDVMVYAGKALFLRYRTEEEVVAELAQQNLRISPREVSLLGMKFIVCLALCQQRRAGAFKEVMEARGGYICHLDATCEGGNPILMSSLDSLSEMVLGNIKLPSENEKNIVPFLQRIKKTFGIPVALVHDMGKGILKAVAVVFPGVPDFICHFHFLRDIGKDFLAKDYDIIRKGLRSHQIGSQLRSLAKQLIGDVDQNPELIEAFQTALDDHPLLPSSLEKLPVLNSYTLIQWALQGMSEGNGYGFPFDQPHLAFAKRIRQLYAHVDKLKDMQLRGKWQDNTPYFKIHIALKKIMRDKALWNALEQIEQGIIVFEKLRKAMRIASGSTGRGLNDDGQNTNIKTLDQQNLWVVSGSGSLPRLWYRANSIAL